VGSGRVENVGPKVRLRRNGVGLTDIGRRRTSNEDAFLLDNEMGLYVVADGMGGHAAGEVASREAVDTVMGMVRRGFSHVDKFCADGASVDNMRAVQRLLESAVQAATYMVFAIAENDPDQKGMGTTVSALLLMDTHAVTAQVGDSRIYLARDGGVYQLTEDHTLVAWQVKQGIISEAEAALSPHKNVITRAVGSRDYVQVDTQCFETGPGDRFLVCSDGLHGYLQDEEIGPLLGLGPELATARLIDLANARGGRDNITAIVVELG
jgi:serine/threonine protein phosphatase PrpC